MSSKPTRKPRSRKAAADPSKWPAGRPKKPYAEFPLTPHMSGKWMKKIRGSTYYFGNWAKRVDGKLQRVEGDGWKEALELYRAQADDLHAGRTPRVKTDGLTVAELCNRFLTAKLRKRDAGEMGLRMFADYRETTDLITSAFGTTRLVDDLAADDFEAMRARMAERWGPVRLGNTITRVKSVFKYALDNGLIERAPRFGGEFRKPGKAVLRRHRAANGKKMLDADVLGRLIDAAPVPFRAMILLGVNCGFGNHDISSLPLSALDLEGGWVDYPRPKTGIARRCPLWPETVAAVRAVLAERPQAKHADGAGLVFLQASGRRWVRDTEESRTDNLAVQFAALLRDAKAHRAGLGFYTLRHVFRTVADAARDPVAIDLIMGHADPSMGAQYRERIEDSRLQAVADHVRQWLFGAKPGGKKQTETGDTGSETSTPDTRPARKAGMRKADRGPSDARATDAPAEANHEPVLRLYVG